MAAEVEADPRITVHLNSAVTRTSGAPGRFPADIATESGSTVTENFGAIIQANGFVPYDANKLPELGYGKTPDVVTHLELEKLAKDANGGPIKRPSDGKEVKSVAFAQCAGQHSAKPGHLPYCSEFCCTTSIKQAMYFMNGFRKSVKTALKMNSVGTGMMKTARMSPMEMVGGHAVKDLSGFHKVLQNAKELEDARIAQHG